MKYPLSLLSEERLALSHIFLSDFLTIIGQFLLGLDWLVNEGTGFWRNNQCQSPFGTCLVVGKCIIKFYRLLSKTTTPDVMIMQVSAACLVRVEVGGYEIV